MMSQQQNQNQNLPLVPQSEAGVKPFSIRQYVLGCRQRNISQNWPFEEKHLELCLKNGLRLEEMLPPLEPGKASHDQPLKDCSKMHSPNDDNNKEADSCNAEVPQDINQPSSHEEGKQANHHNSSNNSANLSQPVKCNRKRRKGKCKKRSMMDILAVARHSTLEEIDEMNRFCYGETVIEGCEQEVPCQNISRAEAVDEDSCRKGGSEDHVM